METQLATRDTTLTNMGLCYRKIFEFFTSTVMNQSVQWIKIETVTMEKRMEIHGGPYGCNR